MTDTQSLNSGSAGRSVYLVGVGGSLPPFRYTNRELAPHFNCDEATADRYEAATGVHARHSVVDHAEGRQKVLGETLAADAARIALEAANVPTHKIDCLVSSASSLDFMLPSLGPRILKLLGVRQAATYDLYGGCAEFLAGVNMATHMIRSGAVDTAVVTASETLTSFSKQVRFPVDAFIFGDAGGAFVLSSDPGDGSHPVFEIAETVAATLSEYEGEETEIIVQPVTGYKYEFDMYRYDDKVDERMAATATDGIPEEYRWSHNIKLAGRMAPFGMLEGFKQVTTRSTADGGAVLCHQGTQPVIDATQEKLPTGWNAINNLAERGNLSTVCVPMAAYEHLDTIVAAPEVVATAVGVGFTYAAARLVPVS